MLMQTAGYVKAAHGQSRTCSLCITDACMGCNTRPHTHVAYARGNISKAASRLDFDQIALTTPSVLQQLQDLHPAEDPPNCQKLMQPRLKCA
jgi:hypothetical protein